MIDDLMNIYEQNMDRYLKLNKLSDEYIEEHFNGIVCISIEIDRYCPKKVCKVSKN